MKNVIFGSLFYFLLNFQFTVAAQEVDGRFDLSDFKKLRQMEGNWKGMAGNSPFFEAYKNKNDTLMEIRYFSDAALKKISGTGRVYFSNASIYHSNGNSLWRLSKREGDVFFFVPVKNTSNTFHWKIKDGSSWTAEVGGPGRSMTFEMQKVKEN